jgi:hypothetical protein
MDSKTLIKALKVAVREVIKEELTEILREGLQSTITEMKQPVQTTNMPGHRNPPQPPKRKAVQFNENKWADILNETDALLEQGPTAMNSFADMMNESVDDTITMTSNDARGFGMMRQNMQQSMGLAPTAPAVMEDPETGKVYDVDPTVAQAMTRDYSALMKAINKKKGM